MELSDLAYIDDTGYHYADYPTYLAYFKDKYRGIYGADVYLEPDSQDGQWVAVQAKAAYDTAALGASDFNSFSPVTGQGVGLSRNVKINGLERRVPTKSTVDLVLIGQTGKTITNGVAKDVLEQKWDLPASVTFPGSGTITVTATAQAEGAINALPNTVTSIFTPTLGWQTVNNPDAATPGAPVESDAELRVRQAQSTANPSLTVLEGTQGAVANVDGVTEVRAYENDSDVTDSDTLPPHSIALVVAGGDSMEIAQTIALHKTPGTQTYGTTTELVYDTHGMPLEIKFFRPDLIPIIARVTISVNQAWTSDYEVLIQEAVAAQINAFGIGNEVQITKLYPAAYLVGTPAYNSFDIASIEIAIDSDPLGVINIPIAFNEKPVCDPADVEIVIT